MNRRIDYGKIALILTIVILGIFAVDFCRRLYSDWQGAKGTLNVHTSSSQVESISDASSYDPLVPEETGETGTTTGAGANAGPDTTTTAAAPLTPPADYSTLQVSTADTIKGSLILVNEEHAFSGAADLTTFADINYSHLRLPRTDLQLNTAMATSLVSLFNDFYNATGVGNLLVYSTTQEPGSAQYGLGVPERAAGLSMDIGILSETSHTPYSSASYPWLAQHAVDYGFIQRFPAGKEEQTGHNAMEWHLRYVGEPHAQYMKTNDLCLEEYLALVREHPWDKEHLSIEVKGIIYEIYYVKAGATATTDIPYLNGTDPIISGDNMNGFVVACAKTGSTGNEPAVVIGDETTPAAE